MRSVLALPVQEDGTTTGAVNVYSSRQGCFGRADRLAIHGDLDRQHLELFLDAISRLGCSPSPCLSVDVSAVTFCDAGGLRGLLVAQRLAADTGRAFRVTGSGPWLRRLLPLIGLTAVDASPSVLRSVGGGEPAPLGRSSESGS